MKNNIVSVKEATNDTCWNRTCAVLILDVEQKAFLYTTVSTSSKRKHENVWAQEDRWGKTPDTYANGRQKERDSALEST